MNNGKKITYAFAISIDQYKGWKAIGHGGGDAGYRTYALRIPEQKIGIVVFSNLGSFDPYGSAYRIADLLLAPKEIKSGDFVPARDTAKLRLIQGRYYTETGRQLNLVWENSKIISRSPSQSSGGNAWNLSEIGDGRYKTEGGESIKINGAERGDSVSQIILENPNGFTTYFRKPPKPS